MGLPFFTPEFYMEQAGGEQAIARACDAGSEESPNTEGQGAG